jgi:hypothetical protein
MGLEDFIPKEMEACAFMVAVERIVNSVGSRELFWIECQITGERCNQIGCKEMTDLVR